MIGKRKLSQRRLQILNVCLGLGILGVMAYVIQDHPKQPITQFTIENLTSALEQGAVESIQFLPQSSELVGRIKDDKQKQYGGDEFRISGALPVEIYQTIQSQRLSQSRFLGPVAGLESNKEFEELLDRQDFKTESAGEFKVNEELVYELRALTMTLGHLTLRTLAPQLIRGEPSHHFQMHAQSSSSFASVYRVEDSAETFVQMSSFEPLAFKILMKESERYGGTFEVRTAPGQYQLWKQTVSRRGGLEKLKNHEYRSGTVQNLVSLFYDLRRRPWHQGEQHFVLYDQGKKIEIKARASKIETLLTVLGPQNAHRIESQVWLDNEPQKGTQILLWIQELPPHLILKIEADLKLGRAVAELKETR